MLTNKKITDSFAKENRFQRYVISIVLFLTFFKENNRREMEGERRQGMNERGSKKKGSVVWTGG